MFKLFNFKIIVSVALILVCSTVFISMAHASENRKFPIDLNEYPASLKDNALIEIDDNYSSGALGATQEEIDFWKGKTRPQSELKIKASPFTKGSRLPAYWQPLSYAFYYYGQEANNTCSKACLRMLMKSVTGSAPSESNINLGAFASVNAMIIWIASNHGFQYYGGFNASQATMEQNLDETIADCNMPAIVGLGETTVSGWPYNLPNHYVSIYSIMSDQSWVAIADPWAGFIGDTNNRWYDRTFSVLYDAYRRPQIEIGYLW